MDTGCRRIRSAPIRFCVKDDEVVRPASANRNTVKALEERGLIRAGKAREPLTIIWQLSAKEQKLRGHLLRAPIALS